MGEGEAERKRKPAKHEAGRAKAKRECFTWNNYGAKDSMAHAATPHAMNATSQARKGR